MTLDETSRTLTLQTTNSDHIGTYTVTLSVSLA